MMVEEVVERNVTRSVTANLVTPSIKQLTFYCLFQERRSASRSRSRDREEQRREGSPAHHEEDKRDASPAGRRSRSNSREGSQQ